MPRPRKKNSTPAEQGELPLFAAEPASPARDPSAPPEIRFLGWDRPVLDLAIDFLASGWTGEGPLDLSDRLVILPTRHAGRRLRESLAIRAAGSDAAVLPPLTATPDFLVAPERLPGRTAATASRGEALLFWIRELLELPLDRFRGLFPVDPVERNFYWALKTAADLMAVRDLTGEAGLTFREAAGILAPLGMEPERWNDLARLEKRVFAELAKAGLADREVTRRRAAAEGALPPEVRKIAVIATPDPSPLAVTALGQLSRRYPVEIAVFAPESLAGGFDRWGRPLTAFWNERLIDIPEPKSRIHPCATASQQATTAAALVAAHHRPAATAAIGLPDPELSVPLAEALARHGLRPFDPAGKPVGGHGLFYLLRLWLQLLTTRAWQAAADLARCPDFAEALCHAAGGTGDSRLSQSRLLSKLDRLQGDALPDTLDDGMGLCRDPRVRAALDWIARWLRTFESAPFGESLTGFLSAVFSGRQFRNRDADDAVFIALADQINQHLDALSPELTAPLRPADQLALLLHLMENQAVYPDRTPEDIDLQGWLELLWEDAPHLVITGMNDGLVPEAIIGHAWLPDSARQALGIRHNDSRMARDAFLLSAALASRQASGGRVDLIFGRTAQSGDPRRPSRLLFQCADEELPGRTLQFFETPPAESVPAPWELAWKLQPSAILDDDPVFSKISVTAFRSYLECPFRFYLRYGLRMNDEDYRKSEMDARDFGIAIHDVLEKFFLESALAESEDENQIREWFWKRLDAALHARYGPRLSVPVMIQRESARQRLGWWAAGEAEERRNGWRIVAAEQKISTEEDPWQISGMEVRGTIDRIERHPEHGIRLLDFKTMSPIQNGKRKKVSEYHLARLKRTESPEQFPTWALCGGDSGRWIDLQLPLYCLATASRFPGEAIRTGYVTLGRAKSEIGIDLWDALDEETLDSARRCAAGVIGAIRDRIFWPPAARTRYTDPFEALFFGDVESSVDPALLSTIPDPALTPVPVPSNDSKPPPEEQEQD